MDWPTLSKELQEQLEVVRYLGRDQKHRSIWSDGPFKDTDKDFKRIIKMKRQGKEIKPASYKRLTVSHHNYGTDTWEIRISAERASVSINKENWVEFCHWVNVLMYYAPCSAAELMRTYPNVRVPVN